MLRLQYALEDFQIVTVDSLQHAWSPYCLSPCLLNASVYRSWKPAVWTEHSSPTSSQTEHSCLISSPSPRLDVGFCGTPIIVLFLGCLPSLAVSQLPWPLILEAPTFSQAGLQPVPDQAAAGQGSRQVKGASAVCDDFRLSSEETSLCLQEKQIEAAGRSQRLPCTWIVLWRFLQTIWMVIHCKWYLKRKKPANLGKYLLYIQKAEYFQWWNRTRHFAWIESTLRVEMFFHYSSDHKEHLYNLQNLQENRKIWLTGILHKYSGFWRQSVILGFAVFIS